MVKGEALLFLAGHFFSHNKISKTSLPKNIKEAAYLRHNWASNVLIYTSSVFTGDSLSEP